MKSKRIELADVWSNNFKNGIKVGSKGIIVGDFGASDKWDGLEQDENNPRYKIKFDLDIVNTCDGAYPFLFKKCELLKLN